MNDLVFSWAENDRGELVHINEVENGKNCGCHCPYCKEPLLARHGEVREHGFAHASKERAANLKICWNVTLFKLAEQIVEENLCLQAPSYYKIFKAQKLEFTNVCVNRDFEREDNQHDVIATGKDGNTYLIDFIFDSSVRHRHKIDYANTHMLEIDMSKQSPDTLKEYLLEQEDGKTWVNHSTYFKKN